MASDAPAADLIVEGNGVTEWLTLLVPWGGGAVFTDSTDAGLEVKGPGWTDRLVNGGAEPMPLGLSKGAFEWLWLRQDKEGGITDLVAFGCRSVSLEGAFTLEADQAISWLSVGVSARSLALSFPAGQTMSVLPVSPLRTLIVNGTATPSEAGQTLVFAG